MSISLYIALYYNLLLLLVVYIAIQPVRAETVRQPYINNQIFSLALLLIVYVHVTFRPTDYHYFGDTSAYAMAFQKKAFYGTVAIRDRDIGFEYLTYWLSQLVNLKGYWFVLACFLCFKETIQTTICCSTSVVRLFFEFLGIRSKWTA